MSKGKDYKIEVLMKIVKSKEAIETALQPLIQSALDIAKSHTEIEDSIENIITRYLDTTVPTVISKCIDDFFSEEEIDECIKFFSSPSGRKMLNEDYQKKNQNLLIDTSRDMQKELYQILKPHLPNQTK
jgi:hypothetical protein